MTYRRYDRIRFRDYLSSFVIILFLLGIGLTAFSMRLFAAGIVFVIAVILSFLNIWVPYLERYSICDNVITTKRLFCSSKIIIPSKTVVVITKANIHPVLRHQSFLIKEKLAITVLQEMSLDRALELLHGKCPSQFIYTNSTIEKSADEYSFVYSFIFTEEVLKQILQSTNCLIIVPASIKHKVAIEDPSVEVYIDSGY